MPGFLFFSKNPKQKNVKGFTLISRLVKAKPAGFTLISRLVKAKPAGFTLIELIIVVSIIAILTSIGAASFMRAQRQGRDAQRKSDLGEVRAALEQFYGDNNRYPATDSGLIDCDGSTPLNWGDPFTCGTPATTYLSELPDDPTSGQDYWYEARDLSDPPQACAGTACQRFAISADLENDNDQDRDTTNCNLPSTTHDFCVYNP